MCPDWFPCITVEWFCPKFLGLPDLVRHTVPGAMKKVLSPDIRSDGTDHGFTVKSLMEIAGPLGVVKNDMKKALVAGTAAFGRFRELCEAGHTLDEAALLLKGRAPKVSLESPEGSPSESLVMCTISTTAPSAWIF